MAEKDTTTPKIHWGEIYKSVLHVGGKNAMLRWQEKCLAKMFPDSDILVPDMMHLTQKQVKALLPSLQHFAKTGELPV